MGLHPSHGQSTTPASLGMLALVPYETPKYSCAPIRFWLVLKLPMECNHRTQLELGFLCFTENSLVYIYQVSAYLSVSATTDLINQHYVIYSQFCLDQWYTDSVGGSPFDHVDY